MSLRFAAALLAFSALVAPAIAQEEEVWNDIENIHGDADGFFEVFSGLQDAVLFDTPTDIAQFGLYPMTVNANGETYDVLDMDDLIENFDALVSQDTLTALLEAEPGDLIVTSEGVGIGNGAIWVTNVCLDEMCADTEWGILSINS